jgi:cytochrome c oxidase subunit 2
MLSRIVKSEPNELQIKVIASRYLFQFEYPATGIKSLELVVPENQRIHFVLSSVDVVHDFWVAAWGPKEDCIPGMLTDLRITPTRIGNFTVLCSQLCGPGHTYMTAPVKVLSLSDYNTWVAQQLQASAPPPVTTMPGMGP